MSHPYQEVRQPGQPAYNPYSAAPQPYYGGQQQQQQPPVYAPPQYAPQPGYNQPPPQYQQPYQPHPHQPQPQQQPAVYAQGYVPPGQSVGVKHVASDAESADYGGDRGSRFPDVSPCRDMVWALLFVLHLVGMVALAIVFWRMYRGALTNDDDNSSDDPNADNNSSDEIKLNGHAFEMLFIFIFLGLASSFAMLELFKHHARKLIWASLIATPIFFAGLALLCFAYLHQPVMGVIFLLLAGLNCLYLYFVRARINFSANILSITVQVLQQYRATTVFAFVCAAAQLVWCVVWIVAAAGAMHSIRNQEHTVVNPDGTTSTTGESDGKVGVIWFFMLVSFYVIKNVCHVTVAGTLATWYFLAPNNLPVNPTVKAFQRATWSSFGSICLGSLIVAVIKAVRAVVNGMRNADHPVARCIVLCILNCLESLLEWFNQYAYTEIAIYGKPYCAAASDAIQLLKSQGIMALINENLVGSVLFFSSLMCGLLGGAAGAILAKYVWSVPLWGLWAMIGLIVSFGISMILFETIASSVIAFFVCYAEDPVALEQTKPHVYEAMIDSITRHQQARPQVFINQPNPIRRRHQGQQQQAY